MSWKKECKTLGVVAVVFAGCYFLPVGWTRFEGAVAESLQLVREYARGHVLLYLVPAFFIAGGIATFISQAAVIKYLGPKANKLLAYGVASVSGSVLAVCSCTVLPLFAGIYRMGAGIGPATAFLYAGPAINVLAIILTARVLGVELGIARAVGAVVFSVVIGLVMHLIFRRDERGVVPPAPASPDARPARGLWRTAMVFAAMVAIIVSANWARTGDVRVALLCCPDGLSVYNVEGTVTDESPGGLRIRDTAGVEHEVSTDRVIEITPIEKNSLDEVLHKYRFLIAGLVGAGFAVMLALWFRRVELSEWASSSWGFAKQILPLLLIGVVVAGFLFGRPGREGIIPSSWVESAVGGNSPRANILAAVAGALMYFATLTEIPILQGLLGAGMGKGPALALLLAGPALSLPNMLVIRSVIGTRRTAAYVVLVIVMATVSGILYGVIAG